MELTIKQALQQGIAAHKEGNLQEAERLYSSILESQPVHADANHNLGVIAVSVNKVKLALPFFKTYEVAYWGGIIEPMTWFNKYIGFIRLTTPRDPMMAGNYHFNLYYRQDQEPMPKSTFGETYIDAHLVDCDKKEVEVSTVDKKTNLMRKDPSQNFKLNDKDYKFYCLDD